MVRRQRARPRSHINELNGWGWARCRALSLALPRIATHRRRLRSAASPRLSSPYRQGCVDSRGICCLRLPVDFTRNTPCWGHFLGFAIRSFLGNR
ncbi:hypothetical protein L227DRAFT_208217 [Lentinus tigrinus ALCF2SS1-6]|uniref:Uncharacterized protein n=1 Tax=Lentinus tigrinus ALCF2SS1-6 TaxID=1328759 RepID=A0A5C2SNE6_9APHY|nr:hypothetical protein L227DRAFT_208217 [Lentinus tigrinus ALCF2SS1-6]